MKKNDYFIGECVDMSHEGKGIVKYDDFVYFVDGMLIGEVGKIKCTKMNKTYGFGRLVELTQQSKHRVNPKCHIYQGCGGCHLMHMDSHAQQDFKTKRVKDCLERIGHLDVEVQPCLMQEEPWFYRNKVQVPVGYNDKQEVITGFYKKRTNDIIHCDRCLIQNDDSNAIVHRIEELCNEYHIVPFDKTKHTGTLKHILTKKGYHTGQIMVALITYHQDVKHLDDIVKRLCQEFPQITTIIQNINPRHDNVILSHQEIVLYGPGYIEDYLLSNLYKISLKSFYQINPFQVEVLYSKAIEVADLSKDDIVLDAYCGIGTISLSLAKYVQHVDGVEVVEVAIEDAKNNAIRNHIDNVDFVCDDAGKYMMEQVSKGIHYDVVFVDPPRKGCSPEFLEHLIQASPKKIVYVSCDVSTQARDLHILSQQGYQVEYVQPVDMFPQTSHVENIALLIKQ